ncbi:MAG: hypothetical protein K8F91_19570 [Candidatus Obscuribacterales bacterium]|nr:hypothetical protein [Candidatus Obscuribacterales bacterium]
MLPAQAQQAGYAPGFAMGATPGFVNMAGAPNPYIQQQQNFAAPQAQSLAYQPQKEALQNFQDNTAGFEATESKALSPYEQQEMALKESRMLQELEDMKKHRENDESYRHSDQSTPYDAQQGYASEQRKGKFKKAFGRMGSALRTTAHVAAPAGMAVGSIFLMKAVLGPTSFVPMMAPNGATVMVPVQGR